MGRCRSKIWPCWIEPTIQNGGVPPQMMGFPPQPLASSLPCSSPPSRQSGQSLKNQRSSHGSTGHANRRRRSEGRHLRCLPDCQTTTMGRAAKMPVFATRESTRNKGQGYPPGAVRWTLVIACWLACEPILHQTLENINLAQGEYCLGRRDESTACGCGGQESRLFAGGQSRTPCVCIMHGSTVCVSREME